jgi:hypothetical protein
MGWLALIPNGLAWFWTSAARVAAPFRAARKSRIRAREHGRLATTLRAMLCSARLAGPAEG